MFVFVVKVITNLLWDYLIVIYRITNSTFVSEIKNELKQSFVKTAPNAGRLSLVANSLG